MCVSFFSASTKESSRNLKKMAYVVDICFDKVTIKSEIARMGIEQKSTQTITAYNNFYNTLLPEMDKLQTFIIYHPAPMGSREAFIDTNLFAYNLLKMKKTVFFLKWKKGKKDKDPDIPQFYLPLLPEDDLPEENPDLYDFCGIRSSTDYGCIFSETFKGLETRLIDLDDEKINLLEHVRAPDVVIPPTWFVVEEDNLRIGGGGNSWFKLVRRIQLIWKQEPKVVGLIYDFQRRPKKLLAELCKCRKRAEFLKFDFAFSGGDVCYQPRHVILGEDSSDDEHHGHANIGARRFSRATESVEHKLGFAYDDAVWDGTWDASTLKKNPDYH